MTKVFLSRRDLGIAILFTKHGFEIAESVDEADLLVFGGGVDVNPALYNEPNTASYINVEVDKIDMRHYDTGLSYGLPMVGICRGGQFLNVMNGGKMVQHVDEHSGEYYLHKLIDTRTGEVVEVTSTHHQQMDPSFLYGDCTLIGIAEHDLGYEIVKYDDQLCFQPHPEFHHQSTEDYFFKLLETELRIK